MADFDDRRDSSRNGGGRYNGGGGGGRRKRGREDDDFDQRSRNQRHRSEPPPGTRIRRGLLELGEDSAPNMAPRSVKSVAETIASLAAEHWEDDYVKDTFCTVIFRLVVEQPLKIPYLAGAILLANAAQGEVGALITERVTPLLQEAVNAGEWRDFKLILRFVACLSRLFEQDGTLDILDELFSRAVDLQTASSDDSVGIELVKIILLTLPYHVAASDDETLADRAAELLEKTEIVATTAHPLQHLVDPYPTEDDEEKPFPCTSIISLLQTQLQGEAAGGWKLACMPEIFVPAAKESNSNGEANGNTEHARHPYPTIDIPSPVNPGPRLLFPEVFFSIYVDQDIPTVPETSNIASSLIRDSITDTIDILDYNRDAVAKLLSYLDNYWAPKTFARRAEPLDKLRESAGQRSTWKPEDVVLEAIFSQLLKLPTSSHRSVYYHSVITAICKINAAAVAPSLGRAIRFLYRHVGQMDLELSYRFLDWFAHHLSNFEFRWKWSEWASDLDSLDVNPGKAFITGTLDKEIRLAFAKRIRGTLPTSFQHLVPASKDLETPDFKFSNDTVPYSVEGREILKLLKTKAPEEDIQRVIDQVHEQAAAHGVADPLVSSTDIYMTAICTVGSKSLSHVLSTIDRCKVRLLEIGSKSEAARRQIITSVVEFWRDHPGNAVSLVDKLLNYSILTPISVVEWALHDKLDRGRALASLQVYEMISTTITKVTDHVRLIVQRRNDNNVGFQQRQQLDAVLPRERQGMKAVFAAIDDAVETVASGAQDDMIERFDDGSAEQDLIINWAKRWARVWKRKAVVEEAVVGEAVIPELVEPIVEDVVVEQDLDVVQE